MSVVEIREIGDDDLDQYYDIRAQAFGRAESERSTWRARVVADPDALRLGAYHRARLLGGLRILPGGQWLDGRRVGMGGVAAVVVRPEARGRGIARRLMFEALDWMRGAGIAVSALHPATTRAYRAVGWELAGDQATYSVPTRSLARVRADPAVSVERLDVADSAAVRECYGRHAPTRHGFVDRSSSFWLLREAESDDDGGFSYGVRTAGGVAAYVRYRQDAAADNWGYRLRVLDFVAPNTDTAAALWRFLGSHAMQVEKVEVPAFLHDDLVLRLDEQDVRQVALNRWMHRIVDVPRALAARGTRFPGSATVTLAVDDPWPGAVSPAWTLHADGGALRVEPAGDAALATDIGALSALSIGRFRADSLAGVGRISGSAADIALLDVIFAAPRPELADDF